MSAERLDALREARQRAPVVLQRYNNLRSRVSGKLVCAFEGPDDVAFYDAMLPRIKADFEHIPFVCSGKDKVLQLREILQRNVAADSKLVLYFIDRDFDGSKGHDEGSDLYITPCYSIENLIVGSAMLTRLLRGEYRCNDEHAETDVAAICQLFEERLAEFHAAMHEVNFLLFFARKNMLRLASIDNDIRKYISISLATISLKVNTAEIAKLLGYDAAPDPAALQPLASDFAMLNPLLDWRGKFLFAFFRKFLAAIREDRGTKKPNIPQHFKGRADVNFQPEGDIVRNLASMINVPDCLRRFIEAYSNKTQSA